jgi:hypothetical protein
VASLWQLPESPSKLRLAAGLLLCLGAFNGLSQDFKLSSAAVSNGVVQIIFPGRADSYYFLDSGSSISGLFSPSPRGPRQQ